MVAGSTLKLWRGFVRLLDEHDLTEYLVGAIFAAGIDGMVLLAGGYPVRDVVFIIMFALSGALFMCVLIEACLFSHDEE